jgi:DNA-binding CsgD family transcriptional regulator
MRGISLPPGNGSPSASRIAGRRRRAPSQRQLTIREKEILGFLGFGLGTAAIARELSISPATVRNHAQRILAKLQDHSRLAAVAHGYATGLLPSPGWRSSAPAPAVEPPPV